MSGLGLMNALDAYQQGVSWKQGQDEIARVQKQRAALDEANAAATGVITASQQEWAANGAQGQYKPNDSTMFKAAEARGKALAKHGLWDQYMQNEAQVAPMRLRARSNALQRYQADGDIEALARSVYPTIFDGKEIVGIEKVEGAPGSENLGLAARPSSLKLKLSDGTETTTDPQRLVQLVKQSLIDPQTTLKNEIELNMARAKAEVETAGKVAIEREKGSQARETEGVKAKSALGLADARFERDKELADRNNASAERRAAGNNAATLGAARIRAAGAGGTGAGGAKIKSSYVNAEGDRLQQMSDGTIVNLGKDRAYQSMMAREIADLAKSVDSMDKTPEQLEEEAAARIARRAAGLGGGAKPSSNGLSSAAPAKAAASSPYAEGTRLRGPDGKTYVVRDGKPELAK